MQKLASGSSFNVPTSVYAVKVGSDIRMFLTGRLNWGDFTDAVVKAFQKKIQDECYTEAMNMAAKMPVVSAFTGTGALSESTKEEFDEILADVATANESGVVIMGTKTALKKLNGFYNGTTGVNWIAASQKESVAHTGLLGDYEGTSLIEIPQRFANNDVATKLVDSTKLLILPLVDYKPIKFVDYGETTLEVTERGETMNDQQSYEVQRRMGIATITTRHIGQWTLE